MENTSSLDRTASWVIVDDKGNAILETFEESLIKKLKTPFKAVPILEYLASLNKK